MVACLVTESAYINKPQADVNLPSGGLFACSDNDYKPRIFLSIRSIPQAPPISGRATYTDLVTVFRGINAWARSTGGLPEGDLWAGLQGKPMFDKYIFMTRLGTLLPGQSLGLPENVADMMMSATR